jgi:hypothetical protein
VSVVVIVLALWVPWSGLWDGWAWSGIEDWVQGLRTGVGFLAGFGGVCDSALVGMNDIVLFSSIVFNIG